MSKLIKIISIVALAAAVFSAPALARGGHHGGGWHGGGGWRGGGWGLGVPYIAPYYYQPYYYGGADCGWVRVRVLRNGHWVIRRAWRCW